MRILLFLSRFVLLAVVVLLLWWAFRPRWDFRITVNNAGVRIRGRFPEAQQARLARFLREDVLLRGTVTILGRREREGYLALEFRGPVFEEDRQQIRNFLVAMF